MTSRRFFLRFLALSALAIGVASPALADELPTFNLVIKDARFIPQTIEVPANTKFKLVIRNDGPGPEELESDFPRKEKVLAEGATSFLVYQPLKPGRYRFFGDFHPDTAQGWIVAK
ncbi:MAG: cupredoxin domain-containing protein [Betaproteobacteria bacterium]|nr:cupredoxin domain-containing protein [Betaproteobacteria bacterium]